MSENSEAVILLSETEGRIDAACSGLNRARSSLRGRVEPFCELEVLAVKSRGDLWRITQAKTLKYCGSFYENYDCMCWGEYLLELFMFSAPGMHESGYSAPPAECRAFYELLREALDGLERFPHKGAAVSVWVLLRILKLLGLEPCTGCCCLCGAPAVCGFSCTAGGAVCEACSSVYYDTEILPGEVWLLWQIFYDSGLDSALHTLHKARVYAKAELVLWRHLAGRMPIKLRSRSLLKIGGKNLESFGD